MRVTWKYIKPENIIHLEKKERTESNKKSTSIYLGVRWRNKARRWNAFIRDKEGVIISLGLFDVEEDTAAKRLFKEKAVLNFRDNYVEGKGETKEEAIENIKKGLWS
jgi:hypothetical protein